tara:strand:- start:219 stop:668 length:450 start_codon:yes stop_codon:yes gene_type:complete
MTKNTLILLVLICLTSCFKEKCHKCILFEREWYINTLVKNTQNDIKDSIYFKITKDTITETKYSYDMSGNTIKEVSKIDFTFSDTTITTSNGIILNYLFFKEKKEAKLLLYNSKKEQPSYMILKTDNEIKKEKLKTYKEAQKIAPHILE